MLRTSRKYRNSNQRRDIPQISHQENAQGNAATLKHNAFIVFEIKQQTCM